MKIGHFWEVQVLLCLNIFTKKILLLSSFDHLQEGYTQDS